MCDNDKRQMAVHDTQISNSNNNINREAKEHTHNRNLCSNLMCTTLNRLVNECDINLIVVGVAVVAATIASTTTTTHFYNNNNNKLLLKEEI